MSAVWRSTLSTLLLMGRRRLLLMGVLLPGALAVLFTLGPILSGGPDDPGGALAFARRGGLLLTLQRMAFPVGILMVNIAATAIAQEHTLGLLRSTLVRQSRRVPYLLGRFLAVALVSVGVSLLVGAVGAVATVAAMTGRGLPHGWEAGATVSALLRGLGVVAAFAVLGAAVAVLVRSAPATSGLVVGWLIAVELIVVNTLWEGGGKVLPGQFMNVLTAEPDGQPHSDRLGLLGASVGLGLWCAAFVAAAVETFRRRDVS